MNNKGAALIIVTAVLLVTLPILSIALISSSFSEKTVAVRYLESTQAFWLAEAGVSKAINDLRATPPNLTPFSDPLGKGSYSATKVDNGSGVYTITSEGLMPYTSTVRRVEAVVKKPELPPDFYDYVIWSENDIEINGSGQGNWASITGDVISGGSIDTDPAGTPLENIITGEVSTNQGSDAQLPVFNFPMLKAISKAQNNYYDATNIKDASFPESFWYEYNPANNIKIPNVVFINCDVTFSGNLDIGGFFIVGGESAYITDIKGNVDIDGCIYTQGPLTVTGGGSSLNVEGGVWADSVLLNGSMTLTYNSEYMDGIKFQGYDTQIQPLSWREMLNPYRLD